METRQLILNEIIDIGGNNGIIIAGLVVSLFVIYKIASAANCTCLEAILLDKKEKKELEVERMALFAMLFTFVNFFAMLERFIIAVVIIGVLVLSIAIIVYEKKQKQQENEELSYYYERKVQELMLMYIMLIMPIVSVIIQLTYPSLARGYCAAIAGLIEILVVNLMIPNFINSRSTVYFEIGDSKYYIYKKQKDGMMQCGDASDISKATKYKLYPYEEICNMELKHEKTIQLSREQVKKLKESLKKKKERNKCNNR